MKTIRVKSYNKLIENIIKEDSIKLDGNTSDYDQLKKFLGKTSKAKINSQLGALYTSLNDKEFLKRLQLQVSRRKANLK